MEDEFGAYLAWTKICGCIARRTPFWSIWATGGGIPGGWIWWSPCRCRGGRGAGPETPRNDTLDKCLEKKRKSQHLLLHSTAGFFWCDFPGMASGQNLTLSFWANFLEFFAKMLEFLKNCGKKLRFWLKSLSFSQKIREFLSNSDRVSKFSSKNGLPFKNKVYF